MKIKKDSKNDVAYVKLRKGQVAQTVEIKPGILIDLDKKGQLIGIEVLSTKELAPALLAGRKKSPAA